MATATDIKKHPFRGIPHEWRNELAYGSDARRRNVKNISAMNLLQSEQLDESLRERVESALEDLMQMEPGEMGPGSEKIDKIASIRKFFETFMGWVIARDKIKRRRASLIFNLLLNDADDLLKQDLSNEQLAEESWFKDAEFHRQLCYLSDCGVFSGIVDLVYEKCSFAKPKSVENFTHIWREHRQIADALLVEYQDEEQLKKNVERVVCNHIDEGCKRLFDQNKSSSNPGEDSSNNTKAQEVAKPMKECTTQSDANESQTKNNGRSSIIWTIPDDVRKSEMSFKRDHKFLVDQGFIGKWVAYRKGERIGAANTVLDLLNQHNINPETDTECYYAKVLREDLQDD
jgi:hypothetical protein